MLLEPSVLHAASNQALWGAALSEPYHSQPEVPAVGVLVNSSDWSSQFEGGTLKVMASKFRGLLGVAEGFSLR